MMFSWIILYSYVQYTTIDRSKVACIMSGVSCIQTTSNMSRVSCIHTTTIMSRVSCIHATTITCMSRVACIQTTTMSIMTRVSCICVYYSIMYSCFTIILRKY